MSSLTPKEIVFELDRFIVGQNDAKKAVAVALRNRWRRVQLPKEIQNDIIPKNILMIGPTGVGKTEIARRLSKLSMSPFVKVEATKFTEIGYMGRDVEQMIRDLLECSINMIKEKISVEVKEKAMDNTINKILDVLIGESASFETRNKFLSMLLNKELDDKEIEIEVQENNNSSSMDIPGMPGAQLGMINMSDVINKALGVSKTKVKKMLTKDAIEIIFKEESNKLIDLEDITKKAIELTEQNGIVFIDEIDKICDTDGRSGNVSREGVQRDLLPMIEGTTVSTKHGSIRTDYILFIASGAFHSSKPSDLLPELQGRFPIRVELNALVENDFFRILTEPETNLIYQYKKLLSTEGIYLQFEENAIRKIAKIAENINNSVENIGARRLHALIERVLEEISFNASELEDKNITITEELVKKRTDDLIKNQDLSKFIL